MRSVDYLLATAAPNNETSLNIPLLASLFETPRNVQSLLCGSGVFDWVRAEAWGNRSTSRLRRDLGEMLTDLRHNRTEVRATDLEAVGSAIVMGDLDNRMVLAKRANIEADDNAPFYCQFNRRLAEGDTPSFGPQNSWHRSFRQLSAKLHCLYGVPIDTVRKDTTASPRYALRSDSTHIHPYARSLVYDLRQHKDWTLWGPFLDDGSHEVDWEKLEALMIILNYNIKLSTDSHHIFEGMMDIQDKPFAGTSPKSFCSPLSTLPLQPALPLEAQDPYNITGTWMRVVCFLDYTELQDFNFDGKSIPDDQPRPPIDADEAIRLITMKIHVTKIEAPGEEDGQRLPVVHFYGSSSSLRPSFDPNANSKIKG